ncbi:lytic transglycosylase domain-containing protein [Yoonia sediminilitoris]|uniref:Transglycosylase-like protein with SLT domain n=1 Tax=Yoonia sediminilitoris TaxID=1286148 RepID=A0A2T6KK62_9RHOB|nr:lytic transglycosylase domain-containing protein [Yoonia sediminilitoris]PUB16312.1 transglycosylase-like protein with SLT domain [Yoonia sediminilitoris]RCW96661.1 transglycosylase-like protein with SLT domain [Yoonia sediminilitoris]
MNCKTLALVFATIAGVATPVLSEVERLQPEFTFRRIGVPTPGTAKRVTVQIDPTAPRRIGPVYSDEPEEAQLPAAGGTTAPIAAGMEWFWGNVSPTLVGAPAGRVTQALLRVSNPPTGEGVAAPRLQGLQDIAAQHGREILRHTVGTDVSPVLVLAVIAVESAGRADATSSAGAQGLMQLMPGTAARFGVTDSMDATQNIRGGVTYLDWLLNHFDGDVLMALAGYNAGEGNVRKHNGIPPFAETRAYVPKVLAAWHVAKGLCVTPPELITDACVFNVNGS